PSVNDDFNSSTPIVGTNVTVTGTNEGATVEAGEPTHLGFGQNSVWWSWTAPFSGICAVYVEAPWWANTFPNVYLGSSLAGLTRLADLEPDDRYFVFATTRGATYYIAVAGSVLQSFQLLLTTASVPQNDYFAARIALAGTNVTVR